MSSDIPRDPSLATLLDVLRDRLLADVRISLPGRVDSFDAARGTASVTILVDDVHLDADQNRIARATICHDVPVLFLRGAAGGLTVPVRAGDPCWVWWSGRSIEQWKATGRGGDPRDDRRHDPSDCVCLVGAFAPGVAIPSEAVVVSAADGFDVRLGGIDASSSVVVEDALADFMSALSDAILTGPSTGTDALTALQTKLEALNSAAGWKARTSKTKAK